MKIVVLLAAGLLAGCAYMDDAQMYPMNPLAQQIGVPRVEFMRNVNSGPIKVTMPDGEVLNGSFSVIKAGGIAFGFSPAGTATAFGEANGGNFYASARGPRTTITCRGNAANGHGGGVCRTQDGATYQAQM